MMEKESRRNNTLVTWCLGINIVLERGEKGREKQGCRHYLVVKYGLIRICLT